MSALCGSVCVLAYYLLIIEICMMEIFLLYHHCYCQSTPIKVKLVKIAFCLPVCLFLCLHWDQSPFCELTGTAASSQCGQWLLNIINHNKDTLHTRQLLSSVNTYTQTCLLLRDLQFIFHHFEQDAEHKLAKSVKSSQHWSSAGSSIQ